MLGSALPLLRNRYASLYWSGTFDWKENCSSLQTSRENMVEKLQAIHGTVHEQNAKIQDQKSELAELRLALALQKEETALLREKCINLTASSAQVSYGTARTPRRITAAQQRARNRKEVSQHPPRAIERNTYTKHEAEGGNSRP